MKPVTLLLLFIIILNGCKKDKEEYFISAEIGGRAWKTENFLIEKDQANGTLISFSGKSGSETIGIRLQPTDPPYAPGSYFFRALNINPASLLNFTAVADNFRAKIRWTTSIETGLQSFIVERSETGQNFSAITTIAATNTSNQTQYEFLDPEYYSSHVYYRLKMLDNNGSFQYSSVLLFNGNNYSAFLEDAAGKYKGFGGNINISSHDRSKKIVTGNFKFSVINNSSQTIEITNGNFRIRY